MSSLYRENKAQSLPHTTHSVGAGQRERLNVKVKLDADWGNAGPWEQEELPSTRPQTTNPSGPNDVKQRVTF